MPLHLLGKKSWNVYNQDNIERVRRDEAEARAREIEQEKRSRANDADDRLAQLRGLGSSSAIGLSEETQPSRKRRRLAEEENNDKAARHSKKDAEPVNGVGMRLADAAGRDNNNSKPWYSTLSNDGGYGREDVGKDVWGNADPRRQERERQRVDSSDPLATMKRGVKQLREAESNRKAWMDQRERDLTEVEELARKERRRRKRRDSGDNSLDGFDLDLGYRSPTIREGQHRSKNRSPRHHRRHHHHRSRRRDRSRSPSRDAG